MMIGSVSFVSAADASKIKIKAVDPSSNAYNVPTNHNITIKFTESVKLGTGYITLKNSRGTPVKIKKTIIANSLIIKHSSPLSRGMKYTLILHTGSVKNLRGNSIAKFQTSFKTDNTAPRLRSADPANNTHNVITNKIITLKFTENIKTGTNWIELKGSNGYLVSNTKKIVGNTFSIKPSKLLSGTSYTLILHTNCIKDISGNGNKQLNIKFTTSSGLNINHPRSSVKICFIHHSSGGNWLATGNGNLGKVLNQNNYYVTETDYGWSAEEGDILGDRTDTVNWPEWFNDKKMSHVYKNSYHSAYTNNIADPGGENQILMFKSCFPNSEVGTSINDEKAIYNSIRSYFQAHPNKLFILITPPGETDVSSNKLTKDLCNWLVDKNGWLNGYTGKNVMVFDFYGVLSETKSHHHYYNGVIQHVYANDYDGISPYHDGDDHPNAIGNMKATQEYITLLNIAYNKWKNN